MNLWCWLYRKKKRSKKQKGDQPKQGEEGFDPYDFDSYEEDEDDTEGNYKLNGWSIVWSSSSSRLSVVIDDDVFVHSVCSHVTIQSNSRAAQTPTVGAWILPRYSWHSCSCSLSPLSGGDQASSSLLLEADKGLMHEGVPNCAILSTLFQLIGRDTSMCDVVFLYFSY